jgi:hypothetical protein
MPTDLPAQPNQSLIDGLECFQAVVAAGRPVGGRELARTLGVEPTAARPAGGRLRPGHRRARGDDRHVVVLQGQPDLLQLVLVLVGPKALAELDKEKLLWDVVDEQADTAGRAFLGLTLGCARCHDHKFDPISAADYYAVAGIFRSTTTMDTSKRVATWVERPIDPADAARRDALAQRADQLKHERDELSRAGRAGVPKPAAGENVLVVEAEDFTRANVRVDRSQLGTGIGVIRTKEEYPDHVEYDFDLPAAGELQLELRYAAKEARPVHLSVNGNLEDMDAAKEVTGD